MGPLDAVLLRSRCYPDRRETFSLKQKGGFAKKRLLQDNALLHPLPRPQIKGPEIQSRRAELGECPEMGGLFRAGREVT